MNYNVGLAAAIALLVALGGCGGDDAESGGSSPRTGYGATRGTEKTGGCTEFWNGRASAGARARASLSHRGETGQADILIGGYTGKRFSASAEGFDQAGSTTTGDVAVAPGDCVAVDLTSDDDETNWVMVLGKGASDWVFLDPGGDHPLAQPPQPLGTPDRARIVGLGEEAKLEAGPG